VVASASINFTAGEFVTEEIASVILCVTAATTAMRPRSQKNREIYVPHLYSTLPEGGGRPRRNFSKMFNTGKTRVVGLACVEAMRLLH